MKKFFITLIGIIAIVFSSCVDVIQVDLKTGSTLLVVDAFVNNLPTVQTVRLTYTAPYFSNAPTPPVLGASVSITDLTSAKTYTFTPDGNGNYLYYPAPVNDSMAQINHNYQLNISFNGTNYTALSPLKRTAVIDSIYFKLSRRSGPSHVTPTTEPKKYYPDLAAKDAPHGTDYYWVKTYKNSIFYNDPKQMNVFQDAGEPGTDGDPFLNNVAFRALIPGSDHFDSLDVCTIEVHSVNSNTYDFLTQMQTQMTNAQSGLFAVTPENVKTNISISSGNGMKAIGWFNMAATATKTRTAGF